MTATFLTDEHIPSVFIATLQSNGFSVVRANDVFGEATRDKQLLKYCAKEGHLFITHDKKDFGGTIGDSVNHAGIIIYTDPVMLRKEPESAVQTFERILEYYPSDQLEGERVWLDQRR